jgi:hypothetical protein
MKKKDRIAENKKMGESAKWRQGYSASGHPAGYKHKSGEVGPIGGTFTDEPSSYDGDYKKIPVQKHRDKEDELAGRANTKLSTSGKPLLPKNAQKNLKSAITQSKGKHGPVGVLPESGVTEGGFPKKISQKEVDKFQKKHTAKLTGREVNRQEQEKKPEDNKKSNNKQDVAEGYYATGKKSSYSDAVPSVKIVIEHSRVIEEGEQRYRNINRIFLENQLGERYLLDTKKPGIARVYARHIAEGGKVNDDRWSHIGSLCEEYQKMAGFVRATRNSQFNESAQSLVNEGIAHYQSLRESLSRMTGKRGYNAYFESWTPSLMEAEGDETNLNELFVQETLDPRIESVMPILSRIHKKVSESTIDKELNKLEEWADNLTEEESLTSNNPQGIPEEVEEGTYGRRGDAYERDVQNAEYGMDRSGRRNKAGFEMDMEDWYIFKDGKMYKASIFPTQRSVAKAEGFSPTREEAKSKAGSQGVSEGLDYTPPKLGTVKANLMNTQKPTVQVQVFKHNTLRGDSYWVTKEVKTFKTMDQAQAYVDRINKQGVAEGLDEMDNRTSSGDRREKRNNSPEEKAKQDKEQQKRLTATSPEMRKKLRLPEPKQGVAEALDPDTQRLEQEVRDALANGDDYTAKSLVKMAQTAAYRNHLRKIIRQAMYGKGPGQGGVMEGDDGQVVFSGTGANGGKYEIIHHGDDFMIHANGQHIDSYGSLQRAMSVLKNEVPGLKKGVSEGKDPTSDSAQDARGDHRGVVKKNKDGSYVATNQSGSRKIFKSEKAADAHSKSGKEDMAEDIGPEQKRVGQLGPTEKITKKNPLRGKLVGGGANENFINTDAQAVVSEGQEDLDAILRIIRK